MTIAKEKFPPKVCQVGIVTVEGVWMSPGVNSNLNKVSGGRGITSIVHTGASGSGTYTITFDEVGVSIGNVDLNFVNGTGGFAAHKTAEPLTPLPGGAVKTLQFQVINNAGSALVDLAANDLLIVGIDFIDSGAP